MKFTDFEQKTFSGKNRRNSEFDQVVTNASETKEKRFDPRLYRPLHTKFGLVLHDIQAHLVKVRLLSFICRILFILIFHA